VEILHFVTVWLHIGFSSDAGKGLPGSTYAVLVLLRMGAWAWVVWRIWSGAPPTRAAPVPRAPEPTLEEAEQPVRG